ncbi:adenylate/guanylate cyclase domain-containing protein [Hoyosella sp. G463]|uniref:Adenylate/guanylate cyclase domain-containing protein n=1 Tax=Lolliginicoccus lacisalsi TaxID=2742202 RepID=A0A927JAI6_9ACTN|nr:adenylate/guanylate cyclase domain-containing protein [Lolliginicoccus lacisalsi]MBD8505573.1 adenylate/guanylate cyclase domain-containing protein [Lolliginicoccus lacisalsi]
MKSSRAALLVALLLGNAFVVAWWWTSAWLLDDSTASPAEHWAIATVAVLGAAVIALRVDRFIRAWTSSSVAPTDADLRQALAAATFVALGCGFLFGSIIVLDHYVGTGAMPGDPAPWWIVGSVAWLAAGINHWIAVWWLRPALLREFGRAAVGSVATSRAWSERMWTVRVVSVPAVPLLLLAGALAGGGGSGGAAQAAIMAGAATAVVSSLLLGGMSARRLAAMRHAIRDRRRPVVDSVTEAGALQAVVGELIDESVRSQASQELFGQHVGRDVARQALEHGTELRAETRFVAVMFVDLVGSTRAASTMRPGEVVAMLNRFFDTVIRVVDQHRGFVNKFVGDEALIVFGAPVFQVEAVTQALATARELVDALAGMPEIQVGIGVSAGTVTAGNVGAAERFEYTVIGDPVNEAARLTELAKKHPGHVLASATAVGFASEAEQALWTSGDLVELRGRSKLTRLAWPVAPTRTHG